MNKGDYVIELSTGDSYIVFDANNDEICILQSFSYAEYPFERQLKIWQEKSKFKMYE